MSALVCARMVEYMRDRREHLRVAKSLPEKGEMEYVGAMKRGASQEELDAIVEKYLPKKA